MMRNIVSHLRSSASFRTPYTLRRNGLETFTVRGLLCGRRRSRSGRFRTRSSVVGAISFFLGSFTRAPSTTATTGSTSSERTRTIPVCWWSSFRRQGCGSASRCWGSGASPSPCILLDGGTSSGRSVLSCTTLAGALQGLIFALLLETSLLYCSLPICITLLTQSSCLLFFLAFLSLGSFSFGFFLGSDALFFRKAG